MDDRGLREATCRANRDLAQLGLVTLAFGNLSIPVTRPLDDAEVGGDYETATGRVIVETFIDGPDPLDVPAVLVASHGPFIWGRDVAAALDNAVALEHIATIACQQAALGPLEAMPSGLLDRHFHRKHGPAAYYGQRTPAGTP